MDRKIYCDYLRILATASVVALHAASLYWAITDVNGTEWQMFNFYAAVNRWGVAVFLMISGALFLNREISLKMIYGRYVLRMGAAYIVWSTFYALMKSRETLRNVILYGFKPYLPEIGTGHYHMWFILMIIGIYICMPVYKKIAEDRKVMEYFLILSFIFAFLIPWTLQLLNDFVITEGTAAAKATEIIDLDISTMSMHTVLGYSFYFILGYYLDSIRIERKKRILIYILGIAGFMFTIQADRVLSLRMQKACEAYYGNFTINVLCEAVCIHTLVRYMKFSSSRLNSFAEKASGYMFGVYLIHPFFNEKFSGVLGFDTLSMDIRISVPVVTCAVFASSLAVSFILNHVPYVKKYIV